MEKVSVAQPGGISDDTEIAINNLSLRAAEFIETLAVMAAAGRATTEAAMDLDTLAKGLSTEQYVTSWTIASNVAIAAAGMIGAYAAINLGLSNDEFENYLNIAKAALEDNTRAQIATLREEDTAR